MGPRFVVARVLPTLVFPFVAGYLIVRRLSTDEVEPESEGTGATE